MENDEIVKKRYADLLTWDGTISDSITFKYRKIEGYLRKFVNEVKIF